MAMFNRINSPTARSIWQVGNRKARRERMMDVFLKGKKNIPFSSFLLRAIELCHEASLMSQIPKNINTQTRYFLAHKAPVSVIMPRKKQINTNMKKKKKQ